MKTGSMLLGLGLFASASVAASLQPLNDYFYFNNKTQEITWQHPTDLGIYDLKNKQTFYIIDGVSVWEKPAEIDWQVIYKDNDFTPFFRNDQLDITTWERPVCLSWEKLSASKYYFTNIITKEAKWEKPEHVPYKDETRDNREYWVDKYGKATWDPPNEEAAWIKAKSKKHADREYYSNTKSKKASWTLPDSNLAWRKHYVPYEGDL